MSIKGQTTVEFALVATALLTLLFAALDLAVMFYVQLTMQRAVREGARYAITGQATGSAGKEELNRVVKDASNGLYDQNAEALKDPALKEPRVNRLNPAATAAYNNYTGSPVADTGAPDDIIIVSLTYSWPLLTPMVQPFFHDGKYTFTARATMKNEPWPREK